MSEFRIRERLGRRIAALLAGMLTVIILSVGTDAVLHRTGLFPPLGQPMANALFLLAMGYRIVYGIAGSYIVARLAPDWPMAHALTSGVIGLIASTAGAAATWNAGPELGPKWYPISLVVTALPCAWAGGKIYERQSKRGESARAVAG